jgi:RimJ/RimL family protein N-acetyltransferase
MITIKKLPPESWKTLRALRLEALKSDPLAFGSSWEEERAFPPSVWKGRMENTLFALHNDVPAGMIVYIFLKQLKTRHIANIFGVYVSENYRGRGIGTLLVQGALKQIRRNKRIVKVNLHVNPVQKAAHKLYLGCGFKEVGRLKKDLYIQGKYYDEIVLEKYF